MTCELLEELRAIGVEVIPQGDNLAIRPASKVPPELKDQLRAHKAEVLAALIGLPTQRCRSCRSWLFWVSVNGAVNCAACHPPANRALVREWYWLPEGKGQTVQ